MKDSFAVQLAVRLLFAKLGWPALLVAIATPVLAFLLGALVDEGILKLDLTIDSIKRGMSIPEFKKAAIDAHKKATARIYSREEKDAIKKQYIDALNKFGAFGNGLR